MCTTPRVIVLAVSALAASSGGCSSRTPSPPPGPPEVGAALESLNARETDGHLIGPGDLLEIDVFQAPELSRAARVSDEGEISLPLLGMVPAAGVTPRELEGDLQDRLRGAYMVDPHVSVEVAEIRSRPVYVLGAVNQPGAFPVAGHERLTVLRALALSEGLNGNAAGGRALIIRPSGNGARQEIPVDLGKVINGQAPDPLLQPNDVFFVPSSPAKSFARGFADALVRMITLRGLF